MNRPLAQSALFSAGVHLLFLLPLGILPPTGGEWAVDLVRGTHSVELELITPLPETGEGISRPKNSLPVQSFLDEGILVDWRSLALKNDPPRYPWMARAHGWEGTVVVRARVGPAGRVEQLEVQKSSGHDILDQTAVASVRGWIFQPARGKKPEASWVEIPISFRLKTDSKQ